MGRSILHAFMRRGWKKSSVMRLFCYLSHGLIIIAVALLALTADSTDPSLLVSVIVSIGIIGTQVLNRPLLDAVDRVDDPLIARTGWLAPACGILLVGMVLSLFFWQPASVQSAGIPYWSLAIANIVVLTAIFLLSIVYLVMSTPPLGYRSAPAKL